MSCSLCGAATRFLRWIILSGLWSVSAVTLEPYTLCGNVRNQTQLRSFLVQCLRNVFRVHSAKAIGLPPCSKTAPMPCPEASTWMTMSAPGTTYASVTSLQMSAFVASNAESCEVFHSTAASFLERSLNVAVYADMFGVKGDTYVAIPKNSKLCRILRNLHLPDSFGPFYVWVQTVSINDKTKTFIFICLISHFCNVLALSSSSDAESRHVRIQVHHRRS